MIDEKELQELAGFESKKASALSLYLNTDLTQQPKEQCKLVLRDLLTRVGGSASAQDVAKVEQFIDLEYDWQAKGVAIFSAAEQGLWRVHPLAVPIASEAHTGDRLYLKPLMQLMDEFGRYGMVLVDRERVRFLLVHPGQIEDKGEWVGQDVKHHKQGGSAAARLQRHVDMQAEQNLKAAAEATVRFCKECDCNRILLGGSEQTLVQFQTLLPKALQKKVIGTLSLDIDVSATEALSRSLELIQAGEREHGERLVDRVITATAKGSGAVTGLADTFYVAHQGRVHTLVLEKGFEVDGYLCAGCGYVSAEPIAKCPFCGGKPEKVQGAVNRVVQKVLDTGGKVESISENKALSRAGHIGAILRY